MLFAYPQFIGLGYQSCLTCHYNPLGNGPLTDYGRALGAGEISQKFLRMDKSDEEVGKNSGFFWTHMENKWFRPSLDYRGLYLRRKLNTETEEGELIHMQADGNLVLKSANARFILVGTIGYAPSTEKTKKQNVEGDWRTREHYAAYRSDNWGIYGGFMDKAFGIRIEDHTAYSRSVTALTQNDQAHGLLFHLHNSAHDFFLHSFAGNLNQSSRLRQAGNSLLYEYSFTQNIRAGLSLISSKSDFLELSGLTTQGKFAVGKGSSVLTEMGQFTKTSIASNKEITSRYFFMQNQIRFARGFSGFYVLEWLINDIEKRSKILRLGPGLQFFPEQGIELRFDFYNTRVFSETSVRDDNWDLAGQLHLWF